MAADKRDPSAADSSAAGGSAVRTSAMGASAWDARYREASRGAETRLWSALPPGIVVDTVSGWAPGRALDLATGDGRTAIWLARQGWNVTGVDFSAEAIDLARTHAAATGTEVTWLVADAVSWAPEDQFDLVTVMYLHLPEADIRRVLARAAGWVAPGGHLLVVGHDRLNLGTGAPGPGNPDILYTPELLSSSVSDLNVLRCETVRRDLATDPEGPDDAHATDAAPRYALDTILVASAQPPSGQPIR